MSQVVKYYQNDVVFTEGPFVCCQLGSESYRVEAECKASKNPGCPALPDISIVRLLEDEGFNSAYTNLKGCAKVVDFLNGLVREGKIILSVDGWWEVKNDA